MTYTSSACCLLLQESQKNLPRICTNHLDPTSVISDLSYPENLETLCKTMNVAVLLRTLSLTSIDVFNFVLSVLLPSELDRQYKNPTIHSQCCLRFMAGKFLTLSSTGLIY